jgi:hypothetical protein
MSRSLLLARLACGQTLRALLILVLIGIFLALSAAAAHGQNAPQKQDVCSLLLASKLAPFIGGGEIISTQKNGMVNECKYEHPEAPDGLVPEGKAELEVSDESPEEAKSRFEDDLKSTIKSIRQGRDARILLVERGKDYAAYSNELEARVVHGGRIAILYIYPRGATVRTRKNADAIRTLAIEAAGATRDPNAQIGPPPGLPQRVQWTTFDEYFNRLSNWLLLLFPLLLFLVIFRIAVTPMLRRRRILDTGIPATATVQNVSLTGTRINGNPVLRLEVLVQPPAGVPYQVKSRKVVSITDAPFVRAGTTLNIKIDPKRADRFEIVQLRAHAI